MLSSLWRPASHPVARHGVLVPCQAVAGPEHWTLWGVPNCGKGQPEQVIGTGHGASPARFHNIAVGAAYGG